MLCTAVTCPDMFVCHPPRHVSPPMNTDFISTPSSQILLPNKPFSQGSCKGRIPPFSDYCHGQEITRSAPSRGVFLTYTLFLIWWQLPGRVWLSSSAPLLCDHAGGTGMALWSADGETVLLVFCIVVFLQGTFKNYMFYLPYPSLHLEYIIFNQLLRAGLISRNRNQTSSSWEELAFKKLPQKLESKIIAWPASNCYT